MSCCNSGCGCSNRNSDALLKFSGPVATAEGGGTLVTYLPDVGPDAVLLSSAPTATNYPLAARRTTMGLATNVFVTLSPGQSVLFELLKNGSSVPGFSISYGSGDFGVKTNENAPRTTYAVGETFALRVTTSGFAGSSFGASATIGLV